MAEMIKKRAEVFFKQKTPVHVVLNDDTWLNGYIVETSADFFIILDRFDGRIPVFYEQIRVFEFFKGDIKALPREEE